MSILSKLKSYLPASSRSLHAMYTEVGQMHLRQKRMEDYLEGVGRELGETHWHLGQMWGEVGKTRILVERHLPAVHSTVSSHDARTMMLLWELYRKDGESLDEAKRRLVTDIPQATGDQRLYQLASAQLLCEFDAFCAKHDLQYWLVSGTLLGAVRHGGFIPWDDDLDVGMCRADIERALEAVAEDPRYVITVRYDWYVHCRQVHFRYADESIPCFIDLFYFDPVSARGKDTFVAREAERAALEADLVADDALQPFWNAGSQFVDDVTDEGALIRAHFDEHIQALYEKGVLVRSLDDADGIIWGIDNVNSGVRHHSWYLIPKECVFPLGTMAFEGHEMRIPADYMRCLEDIFGNIYDLPKTVGSFFDHQLGDALNNADTREKLEQLAEDAERS